MHVVDNDNNFTIHMLSRNKGGPLSAQEERLNTKDPNRQSCMAKQYRIIMHFLYSHNDFIVAALC